ncbi:MAG TPA: hypothetical protein VJC09_00630 [Candidatus Saccharimonadales bacterium]|nr:hypothetical protein [Candidatus Saccharimonadales bacterium]
MSITPSEIAGFDGSGFENPLLGSVAGHIIEMSQVGAYVSGRDEWLSFSSTDYSAFRQETSSASIDHDEISMLGEMVKGRYLQHVGEGTDVLEVTDKFLDVVVEFAATKA